MYAVVNIQGSQYKVEKGQKLYVNRLAEKEGKTLEFKEVLLLDDKGKVEVGKPFLKGASVKAKVLDHMKDDKIIVFKKKRRKGYRVKNGHRQHLSQIEIQTISAKAPAKKAAAKKADPAEKAPKAEKAAKPKAKKD